MSRPGGMHMDLNDVHYDAFLANDRTLADPEVVRSTYGVELSDLDQFSDLDGIIYAVPHQAYEALDAEAISRMVRDGGVVADVKSKMDPAALRGDIIYWSL